MNRRLKCAISPYLDIDVVEYEFRLYHGNSKYIIFGSLYIKENKWILEFGLSDDQEEINVPFTDIYDFLKTKIRKYKKDEQQGMKNITKEWWDKNLELKTIKNHDQERIDLLIDGDKFGCTEINREISFTLYDPRYVDTTNRQTWIFEPDAFLNFLDQVKQAIDDEKQSQNHE